ncbi:MAG: glycosyltransferase [Spirochaetaceae bacterium]|nr:glycosyltransferase [Spirochaetaceae bacterium]
MNLNLDALGIIIIGRNEGKHLEKALDSIPEGIDSILYVDSGSTDGSPDMVRARGISVHELDPEKPFSAARARREGVDILINQSPSLKWFQFLDGDCTFESEWCQTAVDHIALNENIGIVCGFLSEEAPDLSVFNKMNSLRWKADSKGEIDACGGIFLVRRTAYEQAGGFNDMLLTGEEAEFCSRIRKAGHLIVRLDCKMAQHDSDLISFSDWWKRAVWGGYGDAIQYDILESGISNKQRKKIFSSLLWSFIMPGLFLIGVFFSFWKLYGLLGSVLILLTYCALFSKIYAERRRQGDNKNNAALYSIFCVIRKFPHALGFVRYILNSKSLKKSPDPHAS